MRHAALALLATVLLSYAGLTWAACRTYTIFSNGTAIVCTECCNSLGSCTITCF